MWFSTPQGGTWRERSAVTQRLLSFLPSYLHFFPTACAPYHHACALSLPPTTSRHGLLSVLPSHSFPSCRCGSSPFSPYLPCLLDIPPFTDGIPVPDMTCLPAPLYGTYVCLFVPCACRGVPVPVCIHPSCLLHDIPNHVYNHVEEEDKRRRMEGGAVEKVEEEEGDGRKVVGQITTSLLFSHWFIPWIRQDYSFRIIHPLTCPYPSPFPCLFLYTALCIHTTTHTHLPLWAFTFLHHTTFIPLIYFSLHHLSSIPLYTLYHAYLSLA